MIEPKSRGVLDPRFRGDDGRAVLHSSSLRWAKRRSNPSLRMLRYGLRRCART